MTARLLVASNNPKKLIELRRVVTDAGISGLEVIGLDEVESYPEPVEDGATFADNALIKAQKGCAVSGLPCLADDSGLAIDALNGMPGVLSARWAGGHGDDRANLELVLAQLGDVPDERRGAEFVSVCALVSPDGDVSTATGRWRGKVARKPQGDGGFGYDPIFLPDDVPGASAAELTPEHKNAISHRGKALNSLVPALARLVL